MGVAAEKDGGASTIRLDGVIGIGCAAELKQALEAALQPGRAVRVAMDGVTELDVTAVQLVGAARCEAKTIGAKFVVQWPAPGALSDALADAGLTEFLFTD